MIWLMIPLYYNLVLCFLIWQSFCSLPLYLSSPVSHLALKLFFSFPPGRHFPWCCHIGPWKYLPYLDQQVFLLHYLLLPNWYHGTSSSLRHSFHADFISHKNLHQVLLTYATCYTVPRWKKSFILLAHNLDVGIMVQRLTMVSYTTTNFIFLPVATKQYIIPYDTGIPLSVME